MNIPPVIATQTCLHCGAQSQTKGGKCWLCYEKMATPNPFAASRITTAESGSHSPMTAWDIVFGILLGICVLLTLLIAVGLAIQDTGMLIPFAILVGPAYVITLIRGAIPSRSTGMARPASLFLTFFVSLLVTVLISTVLLVAAAILLFFACIGAFSSTGR